jgi:hypothetical protein
VWRTYRNTQQHATTIHSTQYTTSNHRLAERVKTACMPTWYPSLLLSLATSLFIPTQEEEWSACSVVCLCSEVEMMRREMQRGGSIVRSSCPSSHVFLLTQKSTLFHRGSVCCVVTCFHHDSDCCVTSTLECSFVLMLLVSSSSCRHGLRLVVLERR